MTKEKVLFLLLYPEEEDTQGQTFFSLRKGAQLFFFVVVPAQHMFEVPRYFGGGKEAGGNETGSLHEEERTKELAKVIFSVFILHGLRKAIQLS